MNKLNLAIKDTFYLLKNVLYVAKKVITIF